MSQSTDTTQPLPAVENPGQVSGETTLTMPVVTLPVPPAAQVVPAPQPFDAARQYALHAHQVLGRILRTGIVPMPMSYHVHLWTRPTVEFLLDPARPESMDAYRRVFGGTFASERIEGSAMSRYDHLETVVDGVEVLVKHFGEFVETPPLAEPVAEAAAEPEPDHQPAPAPTTEQPAEHPEAA